MFCNTSNSSFGHGKECRFMSRVTPFLPELSHAGVPGDLQSARSMSPRAPERPIQVGTSSPSTVGSGEHSPCLVRSTGRTSRGMLSLHLLNAPTTHARSPVGGAGGRHDLRSHPRTQCRRCAGGVAGGKQAIQRLVMGCQQVQAGHTNCAKIILWPHCHLPAPLRVSTAMLDPTFGLSL